MTLRPSRPRDEQRAAPFQLPTPSLALERDRLGFEQYRSKREAIERRSMVRGLLVIAIVVLLVSVARAGLDRVFVPGFWRP